MVITSSLIIRESRFLEGHPCLPAISDAIGAGGAGICSKIPGHPRGRSIRDSKGSSQSEHQPAFGATLAGPDAGPQRTDIAGRETEPLKRGGDAQPPINLSAAQGTIKGAGLIARLCREADR